jgi:hypothetical protein
MEITNTSQISYTGLTRKMSKQVFRLDSVERLQELYPKSNNIVGNLPNQWVRNMPKETRKTEIPQLYKELGAFTNGVLKKFGGGKISSFFLTKILRTHGALEKKASVKIEKVGQGALSKGYKLTNSKDGSTLFLKKFKPETQENRHLFYSGVHGVKPETRTKVFLKHDIKSKKEKSYFTNFYYGDMKNGYYVEEFLDSSDSISRYDLMSLVQENVKNEIRDVMALHGFLHSDLHSGNLKFSFDKSENVRGKVFDLGGAIHTPNAVRINEKAKELYTHNNKGF